MLRPCARPVRDIPVVAYTAPCIYRTLCVANRTPLTICPCFRILSVSNLKHTLWCWRPTVTVCWNGFIVHILASWVQWARWRCENLSLCSFHRRPCAFVSSLIIEIIPSSHIYRAINHPSLVPTVSCLTPSWIIWYYVCAADDVSHAEHLQSECCQCFSSLYKIWDRI